jgi:hypothetical protein
MAETKEIYIHSSQKIYLDLYGANSDALPVATFSDGTNLTVVDDGPDVDAGIGGQYHVELNMAQTQNEGDISVTWTFAMSSIPVTKIDYLSVVTPILSVEAIKKIHPNATDDEVETIEKAVRHIINAHCGQTFGHYIGTKKVYGRGSRVLELPAHLLDLTSVNGVVDEERLILHDEGWELHYFPWGLPYGYEQGVYLTGGVMHDPTKWTYGWWENGISYLIDGEWGYCATPPQVAEAAKLLVNDYACGDNQYRDKFLTSMTAADWRIQFHAGAFANTGNVRANQLLEDYVVKYQWVAV